VRRKCLTRAQTTVSSSSSSTAITAMATSNATTVIRTAQRVPARRAQRLHRAW
jgi:hypothetical protein